MLGLYVAMAVCRGLMVLILYPFMKDRGQGLSVKEAIVLVYGGLRGALGLSLALMVGFDEEFPLRLREIVVFNMAAVACLTLLVNGTTSSSLVNYLGMIKESPTKDKIYCNIVKEMILDSNEKIKDLKMDRNLNVTDWDKVTIDIGQEELI